MATLRTLELGPLADAVGRVRPARIPHGQRVELHGASALMSEALAQAGAIVEAAQGESDAMLEAARASALTLADTERRAFEAQCSLFVDALMARLPELLARVVDDAVGEILDAERPETFAIEAVRHFLSLRLSGLTASLRLPPDVDPMALDGLPATWTCDAQAPGVPRSARLESGIGSVRIRFGAAADPGEDLPGLDAQACSFLAIDDARVPPPNRQEASDVTR